MDKTIFNLNYQKTIDFLILTRKSSNLTQVELADLLSKPQSFVSKIENCERRIDIVEFLTVCKNIGIPKNEQLNFVSSLIDAISNNGSDEK